jgi:hypothetical protein
VSAHGPAPLTVLITCFHRERAQHLDAMVRQALRCRFVGRVVVSSHNPDLRAEEAVRVRDGRLRLLTETCARGCGHRWSVARRLDPEYLLAIDDDLLLRAGQIARLYRHLVDRPERPHGVAGLRQTGHGLAFHDSEELELDYLCEAYALTRAHLRRYGMLARVAGARPETAPLVERELDFVVVSATGSGRPLIHDTGRLLRSDTFKTPGIAVHLTPGFFDRIPALASLLTPHVG